MITHWTLMVLVSVAISGPYSVLARPMQPEAPAELYSELADEFQRLHNQELHILQYLSVQAERQQREENYLEQQRDQQQQLLDSRNSLLEDGAMLDELRPEFGVAGSLPSVDDGVAGNGRNLNGFGHEITTQTELAQKEIPHQKSKNEKKNHHYMSLCHFKLCNMGRKRNQRFPQFWN